jgi:hypothetical protein
VLVRDDTGDSSRRVVVPADWTLSPDSTLADYNRFSVSWSRTPMRLSSIAQLEIASRRVPSGQASLTLLAMTEMLWVSDGSTVESLPRLIQRGVSRLGSYVYHSMYSSTLPSGSAK